MSDVAGYWDWMIRVHLVPAGAAQLASLPAYIASWEQEQPGLEARAREMVISTEDIPVVEPYPEDPVEVARAFFTAKFKGQKSALAYVAKESLDRGVGDVRRFRSLSKGTNFAVSHARLCEENAENDYWSRMAKRIKQNPEEACVALWYTFADPNEPPEDHLDVNTRSCRMVREEGKWRIASWGTWYYTIQAPLGIKPAEVEKYLLAHVRETGVTDYSTMGRVYYLPLPDEFPAILRAAGEGLQAWVERRFSDLRPYLSPISLLGQASEGQVAAERGEAEVAVSDIEVAQDVDIGPMEKALLPLFPAEVQEKYGEDWRFARAVAVRAVVRSPPGESRQTIYLVKEQEAWQLCSLPTLEGEAAGP